MIDVRFLRNKEVKQFLLLYLIVTAIATVIAAFISLSAVVLVWAICTVSLLLFLLFTWKRYRAISNLSNQVDSILHGEYDVNLIPDEEGELAVLSSELSKMTLRLRDQADRLEKDPEDAQALLFNRSAANTNDLVRWILGYGSGVQVLAPETLKKEILDHLLAAQNLYQS